MYSDAVKVVGADFEVADLTMLMECALEAAVPASRLARDGYAHQGPWARAFAARSALT